MIGNLVASDSDWNGRDAADEIRKIASSINMVVSYKKHAIERLSERNIIMSDVLYVLKNGFVYEDPIPTTRAGYNKYQMECRSPNSGSRGVRVIVIPDKQNCSLKIITVMWVDEKETKSGTITGEEYE